VSAGAPRIEVPGLLHSLVTLDGRILEVFHHGGSTARFDVVEVEDVRWEDEPSGGTIVQIYGFGLNSASGPVTVVGFGPDQRPAVEALRMAIEALRAG
jgi:hypothetical protein